MSNLIPQLHIDEEFRKLIPPLANDEYQQLEQNLVNDGCLHELIVWDGTIIDGHNRYEICQKHGIPFKVRNWCFDARDDAKEWIIRNQFGRRNISDYQRSALALELKEIIAARAKANQKNHGFTAPGKTLPQNSAEVKRIETREELAKVAGVSHDTIHKVEAIEKNAPEPVKELAKSGVISISAAHDATNKIVSMPEPERKQVIEKLQSDISPEQKKQYIDEVRKIDEEARIQKQFEKVFDSVSKLPTDDKSLEAWLSDLTRELLEDEMMFLEDAIGRLTELKEYLQKKLSGPRIVKKGDVR